jgi:hypothetical protein
MTTILTNCKETHAPGVYSPVFHQCWGKKALPSNFQIEWGPFTANDPNANPPPSCVGPKVTGTMARVDPCEFVWGFTIPPVSNQINQATLPGWYVSNSDNVSGSCSQAANGVTTFRIEGTWSNGICTAPFVITYEG